jgi:hypothetical protein
MANLLLRAKMQPEVILGQRLNGASRKSGHDSLTSLPVEIQVIIYKYVLHSSWWQYSKLHILRPKYVSYNLKGKPEENRLAMAYCLHTYDRPSQFLPDSQVTDTWQRHMTSCTYYGLGIPYHRLTHGLDMYLNLLLTCKIV